MIQAYDNCWPLQTECLVQLVQRERVVVTGTTRALGSHLLSQLLESDNVEKVWAINRKSSKVSTREREIASFEDKLIDIRPWIRRGATVIIHNAWPVNFKLNLEDFEPSIRGAHNLLGLAFNSIALTGLLRFAFTSSITAAGFAHPGRYLSEVPLAPEDAAISSGYGQSKLVTEKLLESARRAGLQTFIFRIGQLIGDTKSGSWSTTDLIPSLIASSISIGYLPGALGAVLWLPLGVAARAIIETYIARNIELPSVVHIAHPRPVPWMGTVSVFSVSICARTGCQLPILPWGEWNQRIVEATESFEGPKSDRYRGFSSTKMQAMVNLMVKADNELRSYRDSGDGEFGGVVGLGTAIAEECSETLKYTPQLGIEHVEAWIRSWKTMRLVKLV